MLSDEKTSSKVLLFPFLLILVESELLFVLEVEGKRMEYKFSDRSGLLDPCISG